MAQFSIPAQPSRSILKIDTFLGVDYTNSPSNVDKRRTPGGENMIRDVPGKVRKCMGYETVRRFGARINGVHFRTGSEEYLVHAGTELYLVPEEGEPQLLRSGLADARSRAWQFAEKLYLIDGKEMLVFDGESVSPVSESAYTPLFSIARAPEGGGTQYEDLNLVQPAFTERFLGTATATQYHLSFGGLDATPVRAQKLSSAGVWTDLAEGTDFTVDRESGVVTFVKAPGASPVEGEDNVSITASRTVKGYAGRVGRCTAGALYGVNGAADRLFLAGDPELPNYDRYSGQNDPTYWPDTAYAVLGTQGSAIVGYTIISGYLAAHKDGMEDGRNIILREGVLTDGKPAFPVVNTLQGEGAIAPHSFGYLCNEPLFLTRLGVYAVTPQDVTGEKYAQSRSFYVNERLTHEKGLEDAAAAVYRDMYWLCTGDAAYILDGLQYAAAKDAPYSSRQYECFYRANLPARVPFVKDGALWFGASDGRLCRFYTDPDSTASYQDDGEAIRAVWDTPDLSGNLFYKKKTFRHFAARLASAVATSVRISAQKRGIWTVLKEDGTAALHFDWGHLDWSRFSWSNDETPHTLSVKVRVKKVDKARFRLENDALCEPFGLEELALEYVENGNYKG